MPTAPRRDTDDTYYTKQMDQVVRIARLVFPFHTLDVRFLRIDDAINASIRYEEGESPISAADAAALFAHKVIAGTSLTAFMSVTVAIPRRPDSRERDETKVAWTSKQKAIRSLGSTFPVAFETLKYTLEQRALKNSHRLHLWRRLGRPRSAAFPSPEIEITDTSPSIVIAMHWLEYGGAEKFALDCVGIAIEAGFRVIIVADVPALQRMQNRFDTFGDRVEFLRFDRYLPNEYWTIGLSRLIASENVRCLHIHHCQKAYAALSHLKSIYPALVTLDTTHIVEYHDGGFPRVSGVWSRYLDHQHVISRSLFQFFKNRFAIYDKVALGRLLPPNLTETPEFRYSGEEYCTVITFIGRLSHQKRPLLLMSLMKDILNDHSRRGRRVKFNLVGDGPYGELCRRLARRFALTGVLEFHRPDANVTAILQSSHILLLPSANEGLALVCYEAIENGVIPVSTDVGAQSELMPPQLIVDPAPYKTVKQIVSVIRNLQTDASFRESALAGLTARYLQISSEPRANDVIFNVYKKIVGNAYVR